MSVIILAIESSCDDTSVAILKDGNVLSNITATQKVHEEYGGVVPELASRAHMAHIVPVVTAALKKAGTEKKELSAIACTRGPGLIGSLIVGLSFAKGLALSLDIPLVEVHHMEAHVLAHFIDEPKPNFPFLCLTVSGGHTQIVLINDPLNMEVLGTTLDDAAGEAFDKAGKIMGLPYPAGPVIDKLAQSGEVKFTFPEPEVEGLDFSFSGLKTAFLYFLREQIKNDPDFIQKEKENICASLQHTIINILLNKLSKAAETTGIHEIAIAGGVSANSGLRTRVQELALKKGWNLYIPAFQYCTDNAGMIAMAAWFKYQEGIFSDLDIGPKARMPM